MNNVRFIAIYLPQFYPIPENDKWWGKGFTEWTNVTQGRPRFKGHYQPHLPADLGFYDLRVSEVLHDQVSMAKDHGIDGFCFYHYWFSGERLLERPVENYIIDDIDFPFLLCWANQDWTRAWNGNSDDILLKQEYSFSDDEKHITYLADRYFKKDNYIKIDGKPVFVIYRSALFPNVKQTTDIWRKEIQKHGFDDLYLIHMETDHYRENPSSIGFDAGVDFHPHSKKLPERIGNHKLARLLNKLGIYKSSYVKDFIWDYFEYAEKNIYKPESDYILYPSLFPMWDNSSRKKRNAWIFHDSTPQKFSAWLEKTVEAFNPPDEQQNFIFLNAWNEWAEGNHLEPDKKWGKKYLEVIKNITRNNE